MALVIAVVVLWVNRDGINNEMLPEQIKKITGVSSYYATGYLSPEAGSSGCLAIGEMIVAKRKHPNLDIVLKLDVDIPMNDYRAVRKILQMSSRDNKLLSDSGYLFGLGKIKGTYAIGSATIN